MCFLPPWYALGLLGGVRTTSAKYNAEWPCSIHGLPTLWHTCARTQQLWKHTFGFAAVAWEEPGGFAGTYHTDVKWLHWRLTKVGKFMKLAENCYIPTVHHVPLITTHATL